MRSAEPRLKAALRQPDTTELVVALDALPHGLCVLDQHGRISFHNRQFLTMLSLEHAPPGTQIGELLARLLAISDHEGPSGVIPLDLARAIAGSVPARLRYRLGDGRSIDITHSRLPTGGAVQIYEDATEQLREESRLRDLSRLDALTGLPNRREFREQLDAAGRHGPAPGRALLLLDMNRFKDVNDTLGHQVGDRLLQGVVIRIKRCLRKTDTFARIGGDEFGIIAHDLGTECEALVLAQRINAVMEHPFRLNSHLIYSAVSIGLVMFGAEAVPDGSANLLRCADIAMYRAKAEGRNTCRLFEQRMDAELRERASLEQDLITALENNQFSLRYQPQIDLLSRKLCGAEALLRWHHPERGFVPPDVFIGIAEELGLIVAVGEWVLGPPAPKRPSGPGWTSL